VHEVELSYALRAHRRPDALIRNPLMDVLHAVQQHGSISQAARALDLSYRHVWGELKRWEQTLGHALIVWDKGQPARLAPFGEKLLWAERQAQARLAPQIAALQADLERVFAVAFDDTAHVLRFHASHDEALAGLREHAALQARLHLDIQFCGSVDAIQALNDGRCTMAGGASGCGHLGAAHLPTPAGAWIAQDHRLRTAQPGADRGTRQSARAAIAGRP
jgi:putative molybdopterin biosynthesis protein